MKTCLRTLLMVLFCGTVYTAKTQVPVFSSHPSATAVIFLDFDGHTVNGTSWNTGGPIVCGASGLNETQVTTVFNRVAEDYRPFNVNITTDSAKYLAAPANMRMRVILTITHQWYGSAGGVAFVGSFTWGDDTPCFVFTSLLNYNIKNISEATAHEAGHTLGLYHQSSYNASCVKISDYHYGTGSGEIGWAPIMGAGYYQNMTLWNNGPNSFGCTNYQNDLSIITTLNGFGFRADDHANNYGSATIYNFTGNQFIVNGIVEQNSDLDMIRFSMPVLGQFTLDAVPYNVGTGNSGSNLDLQITLYNGSQVQLNVYNPGTLLSSVIDTLLDAGTYYLKIEGKGNMYAPNYASLGSYALEAAFTAGNPLPLRRLELQGQVAGDRHQLSWLIDADEQVVEQALEASTDGRNFNQLSSLAGHERNYDYAPPAGSGVQYRVRVLFDNGKQHYSNIVTLRHSSNTRHPQVAGNLVNGSVIAVTSPGVFDYTVTDLHGKTLSKGKLAAGMNQISVPVISAGMYLIRFVKDHEHWTEKILRQ